MTSVRLTRRGRKPAHFAYGRFRRRRAIFPATLAFLVTVAFAGTAAAQKADDSIRLQGLAFYQGADRQQRLLKGAKKEGALNLYATMGIEQVNVIVEAFEKKYGIKVNVWRSSSENVLQRTVT